LLKRCDIPRGSTFQAADAAAEAPFEGNVGNVVDEGIERVE
jgi:hypothetical protein